MTENTTNRNWPYPSKGKKPYFTEIQATFDAQDLDVQAIWDEVLASGAYKRAVIEYVDNTLVPPTEITGDRYLLDFTGTSNARWDGAAGGDIVEFNGTTWQATTPLEGDRLYVDAEDNDRQYVDDGIPDWETRASVAVNYWTKAGTTISPVTPGDGFSIDSTGTAADDIKLATDGGIDIDAAGLIDIATTSTNGILAINLSASAGGINIQAGEDIRLRGTVYTSLHGDTLTEIYGGTGGLSLASGATLRFTDGYKDPSGYNSNFSLTNAQAEWDVFETNFGEVSLLNAINQAANASAATLQSAYEGGNTITTDSGNGDFIVSGTEDMSLTASLLSLESTTPSLTGTGAITDNAAVMLFTDVAHGLVTGDLIHIWGTVGYNGTFSVTKLTDDTFTTGEAYSADSSGNWTTVASTITSSAASITEATIFSITDLANNSLMLDGAIAGKISMNSPAGGIELNSSGGPLSLTASGSGISLVNSGGGLTLSSTGGSTTLNSTNAPLNITSGGAGTNLTSAGATTVSLASGASFKAQFSTNAASHFTLSQAGAADIGIDADVASIDLSSTGATNITSTHVTQPIVLSSTANTTSNAIVLSASVGGINMTAATDAAITANTITLTADTGQYAIDLVTTGSNLIKLDGNAGVNLRGNTGSIHINGPIDSTINTGPIYMGYSTYAGNIDIVTGDGNLTLQSAGTGEVLLQSDDGDTTIKAETGDIVLDCTTGSGSKIDMDARNIISVTSTFPSGDAILLEANSGGKIKLDSSNAVAVTGNQLTAQTTGLIALITTASTGSQDARMSSQGHTQIFGDTEVELVSTTGDINVNTASGILTTADAHLATTSFETTTVSATGNVDTFDPGADGVVVWDLLILDESNNNRGMTTVRAVYEDTATTIQYDVSSTTSIGDTTGIVMSVTKLAGGNVQLVATVTANTWTVKGSRKVITI